MKKILMLFFVSTLLVQLTFGQDAYKLKPSFDEEFNTNSLNRNNWGMDVTEFKGHNIFFTERNCSIKKGILNIELKKEKWNGCDYTSSSIWTQPNTVKFKYGKLMIRAKIPATKDCRPAIWLKALNKDNQLTGEIDILEHWPNYTASKYQANFHLWGKIDKNNNHKQYPKVVEGFDISKWHIYTLEWNVESLTMKVDNRIVAQWFRSQLPAWPENINYQLYISLSCSTSATNDVSGSKTLPQTMSVDWIRYYDLK